MKMSHLKISALALALCAALPASAASIEINFDNVAAGTQASAAAPAGIEFFQAHYVNDLDEFGDEIPNSAKWQIDADSNASTPVTVENPAVNGYGAAPSGSNALDARWQPVLMHFDSAQYLSRFSVALDNSSFGDLAQSALYFLGENKQVLGQVNFDQTVLGLIVNLTTPLSGVVDVLLPSGAFYDNITYVGDPVAPVPLPAALPLLVSALGMMGLLGRRRKMQ